MAENSYTNGEMVGLAGKSDARLHGMPVAGLGQRITVSAVSSANSVDLPLDSHVMLTATTACFIRLGIDGTVTAVADVDMYLVPNIPYLIRMAKDSTNVPLRRIAAVRSTADGFLYIMPMVAD